MLGFGALGEAALGDYGMLYEVPASETEAGKDRIAAYHSALGKFVDIFSEAETIVAQTLRKYAQVSPEISKILFYRQNLDNSIGLINQLAPVSLTEGEAKELARVLAQLDDIRIMRNYVLHNGAKKVAEGTAYVANIVKNSDEPKQYPISPDILDQMRADTRIIVTKLAYEHLGRPRPQSALGIATLVSALKAEWKYKHPKG